ncbi:hypothetical protein BDQ17DRAFT_1353805, partial [Cyathus striatus]
MYFQPPSSLIVITTLPISVRTSFHSYLVTCHLVGLTLFFVPLQYTDLYISRAILSILLLLAWLSFSLSFGGSLRCFGFLASHFLYLGLVLVSFSFPSYLSSCTS